MQKIYDMFDTLSLSDQVKITNDFKNIIDNKRRDIFMKNICKDLVFELNTYNNQNYIILIFPGKKYQIFLFVNKKYFFLKIKFYNQHFKKEFSYSLLFS